MDIPMPMPSSSNKKSVSASIPRTQGIFDISKLSHSPPPEHHHVRRSVSGSQASTFNSQVLYMKGHGRVRRSALSSKGNDSVPYEDLPVDSPGSPQAEMIPKAEQTAWSIVDQEIFEWQYTCQTGRPFWWSAQSKTPNSRKPYSHLFNEPNNHTHFQVTDLGRRNESLQRRAISEGFQPEAASKDDLAQIVAVQLLSSCFTLPPDRITAVSSSNDARLNKEDASLPNPRMISSLRMHSQFRYSPCFGYEARNVSPVSLWDTFDGTTSTIVQGLTEDFNAAAPSNVNGPESIRNRHLHLREYTANGSHDCRSESSGTLTKVTTTTQNELYDILNQADDEAAGFTRTLLPTRMDASNEKAIRAEEIIRPIKHNSRIRSLIRSEPHPVFVQPVKELVVQRWKTFRRQVGSFRIRHESLGGSQGSRSSHPSPVQSASGRERRRRAQQESEIDGDVSNIPHLNSPLSYRLSPVMSNSAQIPCIDGSELPRSQPADTLVASAYSNVVQTDDHVVNVGNHSSLPSPNIARMEPRSNFHSAETISFPPKQLTSSMARSHSTRGGRTSNRRTSRKSTLSEVHTADDSKGVARDVSVTHLPGTMLMSAVEELEQHLPVRNPPAWLELTCPNETPSSPIMSTVECTRPGLPRLSTTGTQVFKPQHDDDEVAQNSQQGWKLKGNDIAYL